MPSRAFMERSMTITVIPMKTKACRWHRWHPVCCHRHNHRELSLLQRCCPWVVSTPSSCIETDSLRTFIELSLRIASDSATDTDIQATQAGVECTARLAEVSNAEETQGSLTNSSSSTNSSNTDGQLTSADRTGLDDDNYGRRSSKEIHTWIILTIAPNWFFTSSSTATRSRSNQLLRNRSKRRTSGWTARTGRSRNSTDLSLCRWWWWSLIDSRRISI